LKKKRRKGLVCSWGSSVKGASRRNPKGVEREKGRRTPSAGVSERGARNVMQCRGGSWLGYLFWKKPLWGLPWGVRVWGLKKRNLEINLIKGRKMITFSAGGLRGKNATPAGMTRKSASIEKKIGGARERKNRLKGKWRGKKALEKKRPRRRG